MARREPLSAVARLVRQHDRDRFLTALFAPAGARESLFALFAFNYEVARIRELVREPMLGQIRLQWWRDTLAAIYEGGAVRRHEVVTPLAHAIAMHGLSRSHFERILEAREMDLGDAPPATLEALETYAEDTAAPLILLALEVLGARDAAAAEAARHAGAAYALAGLLAALPFHARARRLYLPSDLVVAHGLDVERTVFALNGTPALAAVARAVAARAWSRLAAARAQRSAVPGGALPALLPSVLAMRALRRLARAGFDPFAPGLARPDPGKIAALGLAVLRRRY
jgi:phytoene synthase